MIVLDTSGLVAALARGEVSHPAAVAVLERDRGTKIIPAATLCETMYLVDRDLGTDAVAALLADIEAGAFTVDCGDDDFPRIRELVLRYRDLRLGFTDAAVIACAERLRAPILTFDMRHFGTVAREGRVKLLP